MSQMLLTHYFGKTDRPFQSLSSLSDAAALQVIGNFGDRSGAVYHRFQNPQKYLAQRRLTESWLRQEFIQKGGQPVLAYPHYFVVDRSIWIEEGFNGQFEMVSRSSLDFPATQISFTYSDSMVSYWLQSQIDQDFYHAEYHGQVFTSSEIKGVIDLFGIPQAEWRSVPTRKYDFFIEAQVWINLL
jgi:hypothetical protein